MNVYDLQRVCAGQVDFYRFSRFLHVNAEIEPKMAPEIISIGGRNVKCYEKKLRIVNVLGRIAATPLSLE